MPQGLTAQQLQQMGAQPMQAAQPQRGMTAQQLQQMGGIPLANAQTPQQINPNAYDPNEGLNLQKALSNIPGSAMHLLGGVGNALIHPVQTVEGIARAGAGALESGAAALSGNPVDNGDTQAFHNIVNFFKDRYGSMHGLQKTIQEDPIGFITDVSAAVTGAGAAVKGVGTAAKLGEVAAAGQAISEAGDVLNPFLAAGKAGKGLMNLGNEAAVRSLGVATGKGAEAGRAALAGGEDFTAAMRGQLTPEQLVQKAQSGLQSIKSARGAQYRSDLEAIGAAQGPDITAEINKLASQARKTASAEEFHSEFFRNPPKNVSLDAVGNFLESSGMTLEDFWGASKRGFGIDTTPVVANLDTELSKFGVKAGKEGLDFSVSTISDPSEQARMQRIYNDVKNWTDNSPIGLDTLKRRIANEFSQNSDVRAFTQSMKASVRDLLESEVPGYEKMTEAYAKTSQLVKDMKQLSLGGQAGAQTILNKLMKVAADDGDLRYGTLKALESATDIDFKAATSGLKMGDWTPKGIAATGELVGSLVHPQLLAAFIASSPRLVGEALRALGMTERAAMAFLSKLQAPRVALGLNVASKAKNSSKGEIKVKKPKAEVALKPKGKEIKIKPIQ